MPINLNHLKNDKRTITVDYFGDSVNIVYRPSVLTPAAEAKIRDENESGDNKVFLQTLCDLFVEWDVLDEKNEPLPIVPDIMNELPTSFLTHLLQGCREDMIPKPRNGRR